MNERAGSNGAFDTQGFNRPADPRASETPAAPPASEFRAPIPTPGAPIGPTAAGERYAVVDVLRGFAIFGILCVNMAFFAQPLETAMDGDVAHVGVDWWAHQAIRLLAEGKFYSLFSLLFGLGMALQMDRARRSAAFAGRYARRLFILLLIGVAHATLLWYGDILVLYALLGLVLMLFRNASDRTLKIWIAVLLLIPGVFMSGLTGTYKTAKAIAPEKVAPHADEHRHDAQASANAAIENYAHGSFRDIFNQRLNDWRDSFLGLLFVSPHVLAMFLIGLLLGRWRILQDVHGHFGFLRRTALIALPLGLLLNAFYVAFAVGPMDTPNWNMAATFALLPFAGATLAIGYAAALALFHQTAFGSALLTPIAAVGRMALSNYLSHSLVCGLIFYSYGLGLFGAMGPAAGLLLTIVIYACQIPLSVFWMKHFRFGPAEWAWRTLTYGKAVRAASSE